MGFGVADAEDILQNVYLDARQRPGEDRGPADAERWLLRVAVNRCLLEYRQKRRFAGVAEQVRLQRPFREPDGEADSAVRDEETLLVRETLRDLDAQSSAMLVLRYFCEQNASEIGEILDLPAATVRGRLRAARMELAEELIKRGVTP